MGMPAVSDSNCMRRHGISRPRSPPGASTGTDGSGSNHQVVAVDDHASAAYQGDVPAVLARRRSYGVGTHGGAALGDEDALGIEHLDGGCAPNDPSTATTPTGSSDLPAWTRARAAPASTVTVPSEGSPKAIHSRRADSRDRLRVDPGARRLPGTARTATSGFRASATTVGMPDHAAILAAAILVATPPDPNGRYPRPSVELVEDGVGVAHRREQLRVPETGIGGEEAIGVGEEDQHPGSDQVADDGGEPVVVTELELVDHHRVVLVDDGHHPDGQHAGQGMPGVEVLGPVRQDVTGEQDLADDDAIGGEPAGIALHQASLTDGGGDLEPGQVRGLSVMPRAGNPAATAPELTSTGR